MSLLSYVLLYESLRIDYATAEHSSGGHQFSTRDLAVNRRGCPRKKYMKTNALFDEIPY